MSKKKDQNEKSRLQKKKEKLRNKKQRDEEMKEVMKNLSQNKLTPEMLNQLTTVKDLGKKSRNAFKPEEVKPVEEVIIEAEKEETKKDSNTMETENAAPQPHVNIFAMKFYENKKVKTEEESKATKPVVEKPKQKGPTGIELNIQDDFVLNLKENPFKQKFYIKEEIGSKSTTDDDLFEIDENITVEDKDIRIFLDEMNAKFNQPVERPQEITEQREKLPIFMRESDIIDAINNNLITIVSGETGSGKSTQVPQFLYERGYSNKEGPNPGLIAVTQPRRIAAIALAKRVADELGTKIGETVCYQVRHESSGFSEANRIKFMTDGLLLREMCTDFLLSNYSVILIDEAHERKINTDILIGLLSRIVNIRLHMSLKERQKMKEKGIESTGKYRFYPLRIVIMSATLRITDFTENKHLFPKQIPHLQVEARQFPVTTFHSKVTKDDYLEEALKKCVKIHTKLTAGGILVFLTGQKEVNEFCKELRERLEKSRKKKDRKGDESSDEDQGKTKEKNRMDLLKFDSEDSENEEIVEDPKKKSAENEDAQPEKKAPKQSQVDVSKYKIYPLYSKLPIAEQEKIFKNFNANETRLIVVATNVAETSITIPGIKYVIDTGKEKKRVFDDKLMISRYRIDWISKASADQRAGRAGRVGPGFCYRLYSHAVYGNVFKQFSPPEITNLPLEPTVLQLKAIGIKDVIKFPFPTRPDSKNLQLAFKNLLSLKLLEVERQSTSQHAAKNSQEFVEDLTVTTELGKACSLIPLAPRFSKLILESRARGVLGYGILIAAGMSVDELFMNNDRYSEFVSEDAAEPTFIEDEETKAQKPKSENFKKRYEKFIVGYSDLFTVMNLLGEFIQTVNAHPHNNNIDLLEGVIVDFAAKYNLLSKGLKAIYLNFHQIQILLDTLIQSQQEKTDLKEFFNKYPFPSNNDLMVLLEIIVSVALTRIARKSRKDPKSVRSNFLYELLDYNMEAHIYPTSCLKGEYPSFVAYDEIFESKKLYIRNVSAVLNLEWLVKYGNSTTQKVTLLQNPAPFYSKKRDEVIGFASAEFGPKKWGLPCFEHQFDNDPKRFIHFARALIEGQVLDELKPFAKHLILKPETIKEGNLNPKVTSIVNKLKNNDIDSASKLKLKWKTDKKFLLEEVLGWINSPEKKEELKKMWPLSRS